MAQKASWKQSPAEWCCLTLLVRIPGKPHACRGWGRDDDVGYAQVLVVQHGGLVMAAAAADTHLKA